MLFLNSENAFSNGWEGIAEGLWNSVFTVVSVGTSSGFSISDFSVFPAQCLTILMVVAVIGASSGSTSGGVKISRLNIIYQFMKVTVSKTLHPNVVRDVRVDGQTLNHAAVLSAFSILMLFMATLIVGSVVIMMCGFDIQDAVGITIAMVGNLGTSFGDFGPNGSFGDVSDLVKAIMMILMWVGRLEVLTALMFFSPAFWKELWRVNRIKARWKRRIS
jgi:trk system potassium uptake protein TrkH